MQNLGKIVGQVQRTVEAYLYDPFATEIPEGVMEQAVCRLLTSYGLTPEAFVAEVERRTSSRWVYQAGLSLLLD